MSNKTTEVKKAAAKVTVPKKMIQNNRGPKYSSAKRLPINSKAKASALSQAVS